MEEQRFAILIDGAFLQKKLSSRLKRPATAADIVAESDRIKTDPLLADKSLLRIYYYDARPASTDVRNPLDQTTIALGSTPVHARSTQLIDRLEMEPDYAVRLGEAVAQGWKLGGSALRSLAQRVRAVQATDLVPAINQKGVDLRIGLDMARLSLRSLVDIIVVVTGDSDLIPAFKFARREGVRVYLETLGHGVRRELKVHCDRLL